MPAERVPMRCVREILRLKAEGLSHRAIARSTRLARSTVSDYAGGRAELAVARRVERRSAGGAAVRARRPGGGRATQARTGLGQPASRAAPRLPPAIPC